MPKKSFMKPWVISFASSLAINIDRAQLFPGMDDAPKSCLPISGSGYFKARSPQRHPALARKAPKKGLAG